MGFIQMLSRRLPVAYGRLLTSALVLSLMPGVLVAADAPQEQAGPKLKQGKGTFVSFKEGTLTLKGPAGLLVWNDIDEYTKAFLATGDDTGRKDRGYVPTPTLKALSQVKPGTSLFVGSWFGYQKRHGVFIGLNQSRMAGTFVAFKDGNLSLLSTRPAGGSFTKKYGNSIFIRKLAKEIPVEESIDGGAFQPVGKVKDVLPTVGEGTLLTLHFYGEGNITKIQLGMPKKPEDKK